MLSEWVQTHAVVKGHLSYTSLVERATVQKGVSKDTFY
jgi:hypothetical protein